MPAEIVVDQRDVVAEGWLVKQSVHFKTWRRRWFVLTKQYLCSYQKAGDLRNPTEVIRLVECCSVKSADMDTGKENSFYVNTPGRVFYLVAESFLEKWSWIDNVCEQLHALNASTAAGPESSKNQDGVGFHSELPRKMTTTAASPETDDRDISKDSMAVGTQSSVPTALASDGLASAREVAVSLQVWDI